MKTLLVLPTGRRARWVTVLVWFVAMFVVFGTNIPGKFSDAENNESVSYLPGDAEATRALEAQKKLVGSEEAPMVVVYRRDGGLTPADWKQIRSDQLELNREVTGVSQPFRIAQRSRDGTAVIVTSSITSTGNGDDVREPVEAARDIVSGSYDGLDVDITGPAGYASDSIKVFESINGTLSAAAFGLVFIR
jgi:RND superfamily putative drug exporter